MSLKYVADFETTSDPNDCRVWAWGVVEIDDPDRFTHGQDQESFMEWCREKAKSKNDNPTIYFHNLAFDGEFLIFHLLTKMGFTYDHENTKQDNTFNVLISRMNEFYQIEVIFKKKNKKYEKVTFLDSLKKLNFSVAEIAKAFKFPFIKLEIDHKKNRPVGYQATKEELSYLHHDCKIVASALKIQFEQDLTKMTTSGDALHQYKKSITKKKFDVHFPVIPLESDIGIKNKTVGIREAYKGGYVYVNPKYKNKKIGKGLIYDVNALYPSVMKYRPLPYGMPVYFEGKYQPDEQYPLYVQYILCCFDLKKNKLPTIQIKKDMRFVSTQYVESTDFETVELMLTNIDLELLLEHYDIHYIEYVSGYKFKSATGLFDSYIDHWNSVKETHAEEKGALYSIAKLLLNGLYGKFGSNPDVTGKYPVLENGKVVYKKKEQEFRDGIYIPMSTFITSWARWITITSAQKNYSRFIYADTDSLHLAGHEPANGLEVHKTKLGFWDLETVYDDAFYIRAKSYTYEVKDKGLTVKCAGLPDSLKKLVTLENFREGLRLEGKLQKKRVSGGVVLGETWFEIHREVEL